MSLFRGQGIKRRFRSLLNPILGEVQYRPMWLRIVMNQQTLPLIQGLGPENLKVLEISGSFWKERCRFREYRSLHYPEFDVCSQVLDERFDLIIAEQVFEHLAWPYRAARHIHEMLNPGGYFLMTTPFLLKVHEEPLDCSRWTATGARHFLAECGFPLEKVQASSWGNRSCVISNLGGWTGYRPWMHSLKNDPRFPIAVWALAQKRGSCPRLAAGRDFALTEMTHESVEKTGLRGMGSRDPGAARLAIQVECQKARHFGPAARPDRFLRGERSGGRGSVPIS